MNDFTGRIRPDEWKPPVGTIRTVTVALDTAQYQVRRLLQGTAQRKALCVQAHVGRAGAVRGGAVASLPVLQRKLSTPALTLPAPPPPPSPRCH